MDPIAWNFIAGMKVTSEAEGHHPVKGEREKKKWESEKQSREREREKERE